MLFFLVSVHAIVTVIFSIVYIFNIYTVHGSTFDFQYQTGLILNLFLLGSIFVISQKATDTRTLRFLLFIIFFEILGPLVFLNYIIYTNSTAFHEYMIFFIFILLAPLLAFLSIFTSTILHFINT